MNYKGQENLDLHTFCDANKSAKDTCVFFRSKTECQVSCQLVQTRNSVIPMKLTETITNDLHLLNIPNFFFFFLTD